MFFALRRLSRRTIDWATLLLVVLACSWSLSLPLRSHGVLLGFAQDDFYYYLKPAQNFVRDHRVTFDGRTLTNGVQPLYFALWTAVSFVTQDLRAVFRLLWALDVASAVTIFLVVRAILYRVSTNAWLANASAVVMAMFSVRTISLQMEATVVMPLGFAFLYVGFVPAVRYSGRRCALLGGLAALTMMARLDAAMLPALFVLGLWMTGTYREVFTRQNVLAFLLCGLPLPLAYFAANLHWFHRLLPVSAAAKQMRHGWAPSMEALRSFHGMSVVAVAAAVLCGMAVWRLRRALRAQEKVFCLAALGCGFVFYGIEIFVSDWKLWGWYFYALRFAVAACFLIVGIAVERDLVPVGWSGVRSTIRSPWGGSAVYLCSMAVLLNTHFQVNSSIMDTQEAALKLERFERTHPGRYAMGDRAGMFGYVSRDPVLQAEGLMMDRAYLRHIRAEDDLRATLTQYGVDYYVIFTQTQQERPGPCFKASEPVIAGPSALRMQSTFCEAPVYQFNGFDGVYRVFRLAQP